MTRKNDFSITLSFDHLYQRIPYLPSKTIKIAITFANFTIIFAILFAIFMISQFLKQKLLNYSETNDNLI